ncbi:antibiotic biosynthesis monooxygenase [Rhizobium laguerreae]|uniref:antibiotic biosynthesis monooxygenase n=1 Tax=Rhizobium laguerreae TaxID=1076926 RepID=UPI001C90EC19|nr:antibiotic biosynthesis monooxygenase [Rhizobium laguerreae]MBY3036417.1 antibiotic biosynthesis monooxygenase [Rhizobium laguerreae]
METNLIAAFAGAPAPTTFIVNVIHVHPGKQQEAFDGQTVVNVEAIQGAGNVDEFFSDPVFVEKFRRLDTVSKSEFHTYTVGDLVLPRRAAAV